MDYNFAEVEEKIRKFWETEKIYKFNPENKKKIFAIDTPPPTVSGKMHIGHAFQYSQMDFIARYKRMTNHELFYPFGTDDNGLATEKLIEKMHNIRSKSMKRETFIELCLNTLKKILPDFVQDWKNLGISCDFSLLYSTIDNQCRKLSQKSFLDLYKQDRLYQQESASIYCPECQTAIAQAELKDKTLSSLFNDIIFKSNNKEIIVATTRPELLPSCVALFYYPGDSRYSHLKNKKAQVPLFNFEVPILEDKRVDKEKGTGIVMCCTFGDLTDIEWQKAHKLPIKICIGNNGKMNEKSGKYANLSIKQAREEIIKDLKKENLLKNQTQISHIVNVHERCDTAIEFLVTKQWFIKYLDLKKKLLEQGKKVKWHPEFMHSRYTNWINGLQWDWCISRQRFFGIPIPVWYCKKCKNLVLPDEKELPIDPISDKPSKKCKCGSTEFTPEQDVFDTWMTSSLTPQIGIDRAETILKKDLKKKIYPYSLRTNAHDIITFWDFNTIVKSLLHENSIPWKNLMISGFVTLEGQKMSKSKGNVISPQEVVGKFGNDALRYWASSSKLGEDLDYNEKDILSGKKFITKLYNATNFVFMNVKNTNKPKELELIDRYLLSQLSRIIKKSTEAFEKFEYSQAKRVIEDFFWHDFCDNYLEIVKDRVYNNRKGKESAEYTLYTALLSIIKMISPIMPFITEELYQTHLKAHEKTNSIHLSGWPEKILEDKKAEEIGTLFVDLLTKIRQAKSEAKKSMKSEIILTIDKEQIKKLKPVLADFQAVTNSKEIKEGKFNVEFLQ